MADYSGYRDQRSSNSKKIMLVHIIDIQVFIYGIKRGLLKFASIKPSFVEQSEDTHASRIVENSFYAMTIELPDTQAIDIPSDIDKAEAIKRGISFYEKEKLRNLEFILSFHQNTMNCYLFGKMKVKF